MMLNQQKQTWYGFILASILGVLIFAGVRMQSPLLVVVALMVAIFAIMVITYLKLRLWPFWSNLFNLALFLLSLWAFVFLLIPAIYTLLVSHR